MELGKQQYASIMQMPIDLLREYLQWKIKFDEEVAKMKEDELNKV